MKCEYCNEETGDSHNVCSDCHYNGPNRKLRTSIVQDFNENATMKVETSEKKPLDTIEQVEWESGDKCIHNGRECIFLSWHPSRPKCAVIENPENEMYLAYSSEITKPETPEAKKEREELEAAYDLYNNCSQYGDLDYEDFVAGVHSTELIQWLQVVRKTGYSLGE